MQAEKPINCTMKLGKRPFPGQLNESYNISAKSIGGCLLAMFTEESRNSENYQGWDKR